MEPSSPRNKPSPSGYKNSDTLKSHVGRFCIHPLVLLLNVPGTPNFAGTLLVTIQSDYKSFWTISDKLKISFIFVHSVHSMNQEHARTSQESLSCGHSTYQPPGTGFTTLDTPYHPLIYCPQTDTKISDTLGTRIGRMYQTHNSSPGHHRELKLGRYTPRTNMN